MFFSSIDYALYYLNIKDNIKYLSVYHSKDSYEYFTQGGNILYSVGQGYQRSPGHPSGNQLYSKQILLNTNQTQYPVFRIFSDAVEYMGNYRLISYNKAITFSGFQYFKYKLYRQSIIQPLDLSRPFVEAKVYSLPSTPKPVATESVASVTELEPVVPIVEMDQFCLPRCY